ncbi:MAG: SurA N-terminal domain-containing protein [Desulfobacterota bacterium]|nr:SurA N-terminal domain-containing protein [Thermodesulfobacteriota bacterium]
MLSYMRKNAASWIIKVLFAVIIIVFVFFYGFSDLRKSERGAVIATVGGKKVYLTEYLTAYKNTLQLYRTLYKDQLSDEMIEKLGLKQKVLDDLIDREILLQEAARLKVRVSPDTVRAAITSMPVFQENGAFSERLYQRALSYYGMTPADFERDKERELVLKTLQDMLFHAVTVSDQEVRDLFTLQNDTVHIDYILFSPDREHDDIPVSDAELSTYYEQHKDTFQEPEKVKVQYLVFDPRDYEAGVVVSDAEVEEYYQSEPERFSEPHRVKARHILLKVEQNASPEQEQKIREKAEQVREQLLKGEDFARLAQKVSEDTASAAQGGDLGYFKKGDMVKPFEQAAFSLKVGEISPLVRSPFGFHIIRVDDIKEAHVKPLEEVRESIRTELKKEKAQDRAREEVKRAYNRLFKSKDLEEYGRENHVKVLITDYFAYGEGPEDSPGNEVFSREAFGLDQGELSGAVSIGQKFVLIKLLERRPSRIPELGEIKPRVAEVVKKEKRSEQARAKAQAALEALRSGTSSWDDLVRTAALEVKSAEVRRTGDYIAGLGNLPELKEAAYQLSAEKPYPPAVYATDRGIVVAKFKERRGADEAQFEKQAAALRRSLISIKQQELMGQFLKTLKAKTEIWVDTKRFAAL